MAALFQWRPLRDMERMRGTFDRIFDRMFKDWPQEIASYVAPVESFVRNNMFVVRAYLPGLEPNDIDISVLANVLTIRGERKNNGDIDDQEYIQREVAYGPFERRINIPGVAKTDELKAEFKKGVVEMSIPLTKEVAAQKISLSETR